MRDTWVSGATQVSTSLKGGGVPKRVRRGKRGGGKAGSREKGSPTERPEGQLLTSRTAEDKPQSNGELGRAKPITRNL